VYEICALLGCYAAQIGSWRWDRQVVPKHRYLINNLRCLTPHNSEDLMHAPLISVACDSVINCLRSGRIFYPCIPPRDSESHSRSELQLNAKAYVKSQSHFSRNPKSQKRKRWVLAEVINPSVPPTYISSPADPPPPPPW